MNSPAAIGPERLFERLVDVLLPEGGYVMSLFEAYFDESADEDGKGLYAVSGYLLRTEQAKIMDLKWKTVLDKYKLPYFHMVDCAHGNPPFDKLSDTEQSDVAKEMIELTSYAELGVSAIVNPVRFSKINTNADPYIVCVDICVMSLCAWLSDKKPAKVAFFIESGNDSASKSDASLNRLKYDPDVSQHYISHAFASKEDVRLLQAADLLAWQSTKFMKDKISKRRRPRLDFLELLKRPHAFHYVVSP